MKHPQFYPPKGYRIPITEEYLRPQREVLGFQGMDGNGNLKLRLQLGQHTEMIHVGMGNEYESRIRPLQTPEDFSCFSGRIYHHTFPGSAAGYYIAVSAEGPQGKPIYLETIIFY